MELHNSRLHSYQLYNKRAKVGIIHYRLKDILLFFLNERDYVPKYKQQVLQPNTKSMKELTKSADMKIEQLFPA